MSKSLRPSYPRWSCACRPAIWLLAAGLCLAPKALSAELLPPGVKFFGAPGVQTDMGNPGPGYEVAKITPEHRAVRDYSPKDKTLAPLRELGFTAGVIAPGKGIIRGTSALIALSEENPNEVVIKPDVFQHIGFETHESDERDYPGSLMGVIAT